MPWISAAKYEAILRRNDDRDFAAARKEIERVRSDVRALRTWLQRNVETLLLGDDEAPEAEDPAIAEPIPGGWGR